MSGKQQQNDRSSRSWFGPFAGGVVAGVLLTLSVGEWLREQAEESATVAHAALEATRAERQAAPAPPPTTRPALPEPAQPLAAEPAAAPSEAPAEVTSEAASEAVAPSPALAVAAKPVATQEQVIPVARAPQSAPAQPSAAQPAPPPAQPNAPPAPPVYQDPNSEDAKLAAAAQVRVKGDTKIDHMLDQALTGEKKRVASATPAPAVLPQTPTRDDVVSSMSVLVPAIRGCAQGQSGLAPMSIVVLSDGRVESAALSSGPFQGTASGRCMEGVVRRARFPRFKQANFRVQFPFAVQ